MGVLENSYTMELQTIKHLVNVLHAVNTIEIFKNLQKEFPAVQSWMIGRGALSNPFLASEIKHSGTNNNIQQLEAFHQELYNCYKELLSGPSHLLGRMKQLWSYLTVFFPPRQKSWKKIKKCNTETQYQQVVEGLFQNDAKYRLANYNFLPCPSHMQPRQLV
jgi:tRNA-dihydrouridine synthase